MQNLNEPEQFYLSQFLVSTGRLAGHSRRRRAWSMESDRAALDELCPRHSSILEGLLLLLDPLDFTAPGHLAEHWLGWATRALAGTHWVGLSG